MERWSKAHETLSSGSGGPRQALQEALLRHELARVETLCSTGQIAAALDLLEGLAPGLDPSALAALLLRLLPPIHHTLVEAAGPDPDPMVVNDPKRADALWRADRWMQRLQAIPHDPYPLEHLHAEQLCRYGVLAWVGQSGEVARWRALSLLQRLLLLLPESRSWVVPAIRDRLLEGVEAVLQAETVADPLHLARLLEACGALEADPALSDDARDALRLALYRGRAALDVWQKLEQLTPAPA